MRLIDLTDKRYGKWTVLEYVGSSYWLCRCDCGTEKRVEASNLIRGGTCRACYHRNYKSPVKTHGSLPRRLFRIWCGMRKRCRDKTLTNYGGRGIGVCDEWSDDFGTFRAWSLANGYDDDLQIDRIDNDGDYQPSNCRWATRVQQVRNRRVTPKITVDGHLMALGDVSEKYGVDYDALIQRVGKLGWTHERAAKTPVRACARRA